MSDRSYWGSRGLSRRSLLRGAAVGGAGLAGAALIGCGSSEPASSPAPSGGTPSTSVATPTGEQPQMSESFVLVQTRDAVSLEPLDANVYTIPERIGLVYPRLLFSELADPTNAASTKWIPSYVVQSYEATDGGKQLTFKLKQGVKYQNIAPLNGREFTSADVKFSIDRYMKHPKSTFGNRFSDINTIETPDKYTVVFKLKAPSRYLISSLGAETALISPPETENEYKTKAIGPGPYIHEQYLQGEGSTLKKNPDYIDAKNIWFNRYLIKVMTDAATRNAALKTNQVDWIDSPALTPSDVKTLEGPTVKIYENISASTTNISWNMKNPKFADYRLRVAMSKAFDRQLYIDQTLQANGKWTGIVPVDFGKMSLTSDEVKAHNVMKYDPAEAKKLFDAAGGKPGMTVEYYFNSNGTADSVQMQFISKQWEQNLGIKTTLKTEDYSIFLPKMYLGTRGPGGGYQEMYTTTYGIPNWHEHLFAPYLPGGNRNGSNFENDEVTKAMDDLKQTLDDNAAYEKSRKLQLLIWEKHLPMMQRPTPRSFGGYNAKLRNFPQPGNYPPGCEWMFNSWKTK
jgi:peptide/nickel transport system substrate-binding protein